MANPHNSIERVLIIDDETDFCLLEKIRPDIIFLDNNLPDGLGWEKTEFICQHYPNTRINLISAYKYDQNFSGKSTSVRIWEKPISLTDLNKYLN